MTERSAEELLLAYGYLRQGNAFWPSRPSAEVYVRSRRGWQVYSIGVSAVRGARPWGRRSKLPGRVQVPWRQNPKVTTQDLHPADQPKAFEWLWPEEYIRDMFLYASRGDNPWVKVQNEDGSTSYERA